MFALSFRSGKPLRAVLALAAAALIGAAFAPLPIGRPYALKTFRQQLAAQTGLFADGDTAGARFTLLPFPKVGFANLSLTDANGTPLARIGALDAYVRPLDLVAGRLRYNGLSVADALIEAASPEAREAWRRVGARLLDRQQAGEAPPAGQALVTQATVATGREPVTEIAARIAWEGGAEPLSIWASGRWRGEKAELRLSDLRLDDFLGGQTFSPFRLMARSPFGTLEADGSVTGGLAPTGEAGLRVSVVSASGLARWLGGNVPLAGIIDRYAFAGRGAVTPRGFSSPAAAFSAGDSRFEGTLALRLDGPRPRVTGTLAAQSVDVDALVAPVDAMQDAAGPWSADPFEPAPLRRTDLDVRISAGSVKALGARLEDAALSIILTGGRLELALARAQAYSGVLRGRASIQGLDAARVEAKLHASFDNVDLGGVMQDVLGRKALTGTGSGLLTVESAGASPAELARQLAGKFSARLRDGDIAGLSLGDVASRPARAHDGAIELGRGRTAFSALDIAAILDQGVAAMSELALTSGSIRARAQGEVSIRDQTIRLDGAATAPGLPERGVPFVVRGPWRQPDLRWDALAAVRRS